MVVPLTPKPTHKVEPLARAPPTIVVGTPVRASTKCFFFLERAVRVVGCYICVGVVMYVYLYRVWLSVLTVLQALGVSAA